MVDFEIVRLSPNSKISHFYCGNKDINDFLIEDSHDYQNGLLAVTYLALESKSQELLAYFCLLNDKLAYLPGDDRAAWNRLNRKVKNHKRMKSYPAVKIGRLGTSKDFARQGIARDLLDIIKIMFSQNNRTGCRFLTVDAHRDAVGLYEKCGFSFFTDTDIEDETRLMYYDLQPYKKMVEES